MLVTAFRSPQAPGPSHGRRPGRRTAGRALLGFPPEGRQRRGEAPVPAHPAGAGLRLLAPRETLGPPWPPGGPSRPGPTGLEAGSHPSTALAPDTALGLQVKPAMTRIGLRGWAEAASGCGL